MALAAKAAHPGCLLERAVWVEGAQMGAVGCRCTPGLARRWILGWVRSSDEGMNRGEAVFMPRNAFVAGRALPC